MKNKVKKFKVWVVKNKNELIATVLIVALSASIVHSINLIGKAVEHQEEQWRKIIENNLRLIKEGDFFDILVDEYSDEYTKKVISKRWTKLNGEALYLGKYTRTVDLSEEEKIGKQIDKIGLGITNTINKIIKK